MIVDGTGNPWCWAYIGIVAGELHRFSIEDVLVNGIVVVEKGNHTGAKTREAILGPGFRQ